MEDNYILKNRMVAWLAVVLIIGLIVSFAFNDGYERVGGIGLGTIFLAIVIGCFRTGRFFTWDGPIEPNNFEGIVGWTGAVLMITAIIGFFLRVALGKY